MNRRKSQQGFSVLLTLLLIGIVAAAGGTSVFIMKKNTAVKKEVVVENVSPTPTLTPAVVSLENAEIEEETKIKALDDDAINIDQGINDKQGDLYE